MSRSMCATPLAAALDRSLAIVGAPSGFCGVHRHPLSVTNMQEGIRGASAITTRTARKTLPCCGTGTAPPCGPLSALSKGILAMNANRRLTTLTRVGFATRGLLYMVIALLIIRAGRAESPAGALQYLGEGGGRILLVVMAAGLSAYSIWRLADAAFDIERHGADRKGVIERVGAAASGVAHILLAWQAVKLIEGVASASDGTEEGARAALALPGGGTLVIVAGVVLLGVGAFQLVKAIKGSFLRHLEPHVARQPWAQWSGRAGYAARGLVFLVSGFLIAKAGFVERAEQAGGTGEALSWLSSPLDVLVALGLFAFGLFSLIEARFRVLHDVPVDEAVRHATSAHS